MGELEESDTSMFNEGIADVRLRVAQILHQYPKTRASDTLLILQYWLKWSGLGRHIKHMRGDDGKGYDVIDDSFIKHATSAETITRARRFLQNNEGKYLPSKDVQDRRKQAEQKFKHIFGKRDVGQDGEEKEAA